MTVRVVVESAGDIMVLRPIGRLDLASTVDLRRGLWKAVAQQPSGIVVDLAGLTVEETGPLTLFFSFAGHAGQPPGCPVVLCTPSAALRSSLDRLGVSRAVPVCSTRAQALAAVDSAPAPSRYRRLLPASPGAAALARHVVAEACRAWNLPDVVEDAQIVVTELVANAVLHAGGDTRLTVVLERRYLHVSVWDRSPLAAVRAWPGTRGGRGLVLVEALATSWGSTPMAGGKAVWATLRLDRSSR